MTTRERILTLADGGHEPHMIAALLDLSVADVASTLAEPEFTPGMEPQVSTPGALPQQNLTGGSVDAYLYAVGKGSVDVTVLAPDKETALFQAPVTIGADGTVIPVTMRVPPDCWIVGVPSEALTLSEVEFVSD